MNESVLQLKCGIKNDDWGKKGKESKAARLWSRTPGNGPIDDSKMYSEMWMGTYPKNPSYVISSGLPLADHLKQNPQVIGKVGVARWGAEIPFLSKILSFSKALPLQIHQDKALAKTLHQEDPEKFADSNHKPEIAIALSQFELFVGWKPLDDIQVLLKLKPLERYAPQHGHLTDEVLKEVCKALLTASPEMVKDTIKELQTIPESQFGVSYYIPQMLIRLSSQYSEGDNGHLVATLLMNYMTLKPGDAVCVPPDSIHAYLHGDIIECMASSDNVLNTGFCPIAERDSVELFSRALTFKPHSVREAKLPKKRSEKGMLDKTDEYAPPISEFNVLATCLDAEEREKHKAIFGPSLVVVTEGTGHMGVSGLSLNLEEGYVFFVGQGVPLEFSTAEGMNVYRAYAE
ncbi:hypothetical protein V494_01366 [Pseudogymnoascus sp. VKM F-4513 (FW-928)]|nr:hypothetical protein V494_01366 [Pseudogymnoascus sp. VKM F-4513 (FW-928)]